MKTVKKFVTFDGVEHVSETNALHHLDEIQGDIFCKIAREVAACDGKYTKTLEILRQNLTRLLLLSDVSKDMQLEEDEG